MARINKERLYLTLNRFAALQILIGIVSTALCVSALGRDRTDFPDIEKELGSVVKYVILGLDVGAVIGSGWVGEHFNVSECIFGYDSAYI